MLECYSRYSLSWRKPWLFHWPSHHVSTLEKMLTFFVWTPHKPHKVQSCCCTQFYNINAELGVVEYLKCLSCQHLWTHVIFIESHLESCKTLNRFTASGTCLRKTNDHCLSCYQVITLGTLLVTFFLQKSWWKAVLRNIVYRWRTEVFVAGI